MITWDLSCMKTSPRFIPDQRNDSVLDLPYAVLYYHRLDGIEAGRKPVLPIAGVLVR